MSKLKELIRTQCPNGVQYYFLGELCTLEKGNTPIQKAIPGEYPLVVTTDERRSSNTYQFAKPTVCIPLISSRGHGVASLNKVYYQDGKFALGNILCGVTPINENMLSAQFLCYYLNYKKDVLLVPLMRGGANVALTVDSLKRIKIPVPPIEVQQETVRILDSFIEFTAELTTELTARKQQFKYYCDKLICPHGLESLGLPDEWKETTLGEIGTLTRGKRFVKADSEGLMTGVPCIHYGELYTYYGICANKTKSYVSPELAKKLRFAKPRDVVIVGAGENNIDIGVGVAWMGDTAVAVHDACYIYKHNENPKFISYYLRTDFYHNQLKKYVSEGKICSVSSDGIGKSVIFLPSLEVQNKIVDILDNFNNLCNDLTSGLPAEIEARQKQYEYYRDKLLDFKEIS